MSTAAILEGRGPSSPTRWPDILALAVLALLVAACGDPRPAAATGEGASGLDACVYCHGSFGRSGYLPGTDPLLRSAPPVAPSGKPAAVVGAHLIHLNPPVSGAIRAPIACAECHVVPTNMTHAWRPPASPVAFGTIATARGAAPTYQPVTLGCSAVYCHGNFAFDGVTGANATPLWTGASLTCVSCHGMPPTGHPALTGTVTAATCSQCHPNTVNPDGSINVNGGGHVNGLADVSFDCTSCHGTAGRIGILPGTDPLLASAPPVAPSGKPVAVVGAHLIHLNPPISGALRAPISCNECHVVPNDTTHATNSPANPVTFGALAAARGAAPTYQPATLGCSAVYCHGNFAFDGVTGANATPLWTGASLTCVSCHGMPPTGHPALTGTVTAATCSQCHPNTVNPDGSINVNGGGHVNGLADVSFDCTSCHGTAGRIGILPGTDPLLASAPPVAPVGAPPSAVGAHQRHLNPAAAGAVHGPVPCAECHVVPTTLAHATSPPAVKVVFGALATAQGAVPTWTPSTTGCSATYCHGNFAFNGVTGASAAPLWTGATVSCASCHGMPPTGHPALTGTVTPATCSQCHPSTVNADGTINLAAGAHLNGRSDVVPAGCTTCHGTAGRAGILPGTDPLLASAPPVAPGGAPAFAVGAHQSHLNPPVTGSFRGPIACAECHVVPASSAHATSPPAVKVVFGPLARTGGASPTWTSTSTGCAATYCHGTFSFNGVTGASATPIWTGGGLSCTSCHGMPPTGHPALQGTVTPVTCNQCHPSTVNVDGTINLAAAAHLNGRSDVVAAGCTSCHGTAGRAGNLAGTDPQLAASPPVATTGAPAFAVGAHQFHVNPPSAGAFRGPILCNECHTVPTDSAHAASPPASPVVFGALARAQGAAPAWSATTTGCSATYCHGNFTFNGVRGASGTPLWTDTTITCVSCHGLPPTGHPALSGTVTAATCSQCHPSTVNANGTINVATGAHIDGQASVAASCTSCHGDATRASTTVNPLLAAAPPVAPAGLPASVVGTHLLHLTDNAIRGAVACDSCHVVPASSDHSVQLPARVVFTAGTLGTTQGRAPIYDATTLSCSTTYCHGSFTFNAVVGSATATPAWNATPALLCTGCHGMPPSGHPALTGTVTAATCNQCHPDTVSSNGTIDVAGGRHMNGLADVTGNPHTDALWADPTHHGYSANQQGLQNCTGCHLNFGSPAGTTGGSCNQCHSGGTTGWQTDCTFCHGAAGRTGNVSGTDARLAIAPPVGPQGQTLTTEAMVGAHQRHVNPPVAGRMAAPFACVVCHATPLPASVAHVNGQPVPVPFGGIALTGNVAPTFNPTTLTCSATYCHGNFAGGATTAAPTWTGAATTCTSCHATPPATGQHGRSEHLGAGCGACHSGYAATTANVALHVNGAKDVGGAGTSINSWNSTTKSCGPGCHGTETW